jgi:hypothetical protein
MAQISKGDTFTDGQQVTGARLNQLVDASQLLVGAITDQPSITANTLEATDSTIVNDAGVLKEATIGDILNSNIPVTTSSINGVAGADIVLTPAAGREVDIAGNFQVIGNSSVAGTFAVTGDASFNANTAIKIPVGTTVQRPAIPVAGQLRYNSTLDQAEIYSGTEWKAVGGSPFDASGGTETTVDGFKIHTFTTSGTFTPALNREGKIEYLVAGAGGSGAYFAPQGGGGGGGGDVKTGFLTIAKNTAPMAVTVGLNVSGNGNPSSFSTITANGGTAGSGRSGGTSGSGFAGGGPDNGGGAGGGARSTEIAPRGDNIGGFGGRGVGSYISGFYQEYGGGGSGSGGGSGGFVLHLACSPEGVWGGGGRNVAPVANSGGGGGGGSSGVTATAGANGVVIIRYRVS